MKKLVLVRYLRSFVLLVFGLLLSVSLSSVVHGQQVITIPNSASGSYQDTPNGPRIGVVSNATRVVAAVTGGRLELLKTGDRAAAEPGDTVVYRLLLRNTGAGVVSGVQLIDTLPQGIEFVPGSTQASLSNQGLGGSPVTLPPPVVNGRTVTFAYPSLAPGQSLTVAYGVQLTPDAVRGSGRNLAIAQGLGPGGVLVQSATASHLVRIRPGILSDCGTIIGRVFVDKNFDGEQQPGEPGVPNAVVFMDDGNRITTDADGLFSLAYVIAGYRTGTLDLTSLPGYTLAPNHYRIEKNSASRLVRLAPGGLARMNFAVTPTSQEVPQ